MTELTTPPNLEQQREIAGEILGLNTETSTNPEQFDETVTHFLNQSDAQGMAKLLPHRLVWSQSQTKSFFSEGEHQPLQVFEFTTDKDEKSKQYALIGTVLRLEYEEAKKRRADDLPRRRNRLNAFIHRTTMELFVDDYIQQNNKYNGVSTESINDGNPELTDEYRDLLTECAERVSDNPKDLVEKVIEATAGGDLQSLYTFIQEYKGEEDVRVVIEQVVKTRVADRKLATEKLALTFEIAKYRRMFGVDLDLMYEVGRYPNSNELEVSMKSTLINTTNDLETAISEQTPYVYSKYKENGLVESNALYLESAESNDRPDTISSRTNEGLDIILQDVMSHLTVIDANPIDGIFFVDAPGMRARSSDISYLNHLKKLVKIVYINKKLPDNKLKRIIAHELIQSIHAELVQRAHGIQIDDIDTKEREEVSRVIEQQFDESPKTNESVTALLRARHQAHYALVQNEYRKEIDELLKTGADNIDNGAINNLLDSMEVYVHETLQTGIPISNSIFGIASGLEPLKDFDGGRYVPNQEFNSDLETAMREKFGDSWIGNYDARAVFYYTMAQMGDNDEKKDSAQIVHDTNPDFALEGLIHWGFDLKLV